MLVFTEISYWQQKVKESGDCKFENNNHWIHKFTTPPVKIMGQDASSLSALQSKVGYKFRNPQLLEEALTHDSLRATNHKLKDYQRLEHLGDAVIHFVISNYLFRTYPSWNEGQLSGQRAAMVGQKKQKQIADGLGLETFVKMSQGVQQFGRYDKFLEALIGGIFMDAGGEDGGGYGEARKVIYNLWGLGTPTGQGECSIV